MSLLYDISTWILPVVTAITFHEVAHGLVAERLGDPTARQAGRLTLNPLKHIDRFGTIVLPALLLIPRVLYGVPTPVLGYAKPVPVDFTRLRRPLRDMVWVALAGPGANVLLALLAAILFYAVLPLPGGEEVAREGLVSFFDPRTPVALTPAAWLAANLAHAILINVILCCFNLLPLPPLDGSRVAVGLLPRRLAMPIVRIERYGLLIVLFLLVGVPWIGQQFGYDWNILGWVIGVPAEWLIRFLLMITGHPT
jgi:Zn-dependent protease